MNGWFRDFFKEELKPYPGRAALVARMVIASTLVMLISMIFRMPYGTYAAIYAITISRESPQTTVKAVKTILIAFLFAAADVLIGATFFLEDPLWRLVWVLGMFFTMFYGLSALSNYAAASRFGYLVVITTPLWDRHISANDRVEGTLWAVYAISISSVITALLEIVFAQFKQADDLNQGIKERLTSVEEVLALLAAARAVDSPTANKVTRLSTVGTSTLRRLLERSTHTAQYREQMGAVVALVGRLVDLAANLTYSDRPLSDDDHARFGRLGEQMSKLRTALQNGRTPLGIKIESNAASAAPFLREMETTAALIPEVFAGSISTRVYAAPPEGHEPAPGLLVPDALTNPEHIKFALKGGLAAGLCYITYNLLFWPGISTAVTTCLLTALTTIGASHQKQTLRFAGTLVGAAIAMGAQIFILPYIDSIGGFTLLFASVISLAAWVATSSTRLSYAGVQVAVAFCLINLEEFRIQTSLALARDRVVGILLGLFMMWLVFDRLWGSPAGVQMKNTFVSTLRLLAAFVREPVSADRKVAVERSYSLRETINKNFDKVRSLADGALFEFGTSRPQNLALREHIREWQPRLRTFFVMRIALLKYRLRLPGFELPEAMEVAQKEFDEQLANVLERMAERIEGKAEESENKVEDLFERLQETACNFPEGSRELQTFLLLAQRSEQLIRELDKEIARSSAASQSTGLLPFTSGLDAPA
jgi:multidrug resistance protein MdtO